MTASGSRLVFPVMGTVTSIVISGDDVARLGEEASNDVLHDTRRELEAVDRRFSHYSRDSEISTWLAGGAVDAAAVADIAFVLGECGRLHEASGGVFSIENPQTGVLDTAGFVKGYGIRRAVDVMRAGGASHFMITVGGDTFCSGRASADRPWRVAIADPVRSHGIAALVEASDLAVATSGTAERGDHIWNLARNADPAILSFTVVGPDVAEADAFATIGFAMGEPGIAWVAAHEGYRSLVIRPDGRVVGDAALVSAA